MMIGISKTYTYAYTSTDSIILKFADDIVVVRSDLRNWDSLFKVGVEAVILV